MELIRRALIIFLFASVAAAQPILLQPDRVFDAVSTDAHEGWVVLVNADKIAAVGPLSTVSAANAKIIDLPGMTLLPGLIDAHSHLFLHPYNETLWNDQVLKEPLEYRTIAATLHARATLMAGFTALRDLGTEGAGYADVSLKRAIDEGRIPGPRLFVVTRASSRHRATVRVRRVSRRTSSRRKARRRRVARPRFSKRCAIRLPTAPIGSRSTPIIGAASVRLLPRSPLTN